MIFVNFNNTPRNGDLNISGPLRATITLMWSSVKRGLTPLSTAVSSLFPTLIMLPYTWKCLCNFYKLSENKQTLRSHHVWVCFIAVTATQSHILLSACPQNNIPHKSPGAWKLKRERKTEDTWHWSAPVVLRLSLINFSKNSCFVTKMQTHILVFSYLSDDITTFAAPLGDEE